MNILFGLGKHALTKSVVPVLAAAKWNMTIHVLGFSALCLDLAVTPGLRLVDDILASK